MRGTSVNAKELGAMPASAQLHTIDGNWQKEPLAKYSGLTLRQHFSGLVMQGLLANERWFMNVVNENLGIDKARRAEALVAEAAVAGADALLAELAKDKP